MLFALPLFLPHKVTENIFLSIFISFHDFNILKSVALRYPHVLYKVSIDFVDLIITLFSLSKTKIYTFI